MNELNNIAKELAESPYTISLIYAFNATGKTQLSVAYKDVTKENNGGEHAGVYYNAYSEDLFQWDNDEEDNNRNVNLRVIPSSLNNFHSYLLEDPNRIQEKLNKYYPNYTFRLNSFGRTESDSEKGIYSISFFSKEDEEMLSPIKISRGEERIFIWCFFLALFEYDDWVGKQSAHIFIDDPISSLDDHNLYITTDSICELIDNNYKQKKIFITTHHIGMFSVLSDWLTKGDKSKRFEKLTRLCILERTDAGIQLKECNEGVFLFHLHLLKTLQDSVNSEIYSYHFVLLRQLLENISSFLGSGRTSYVLDRIGISDSNNIMNQINSLSHKDAYQLLYYKPSSSETKLMKDVIAAIQNKYQFHI